MLGAQVVSGINGRPPTHWACIQPTELALWFRLGFQYNVGGFGNQFTLKMYMESFIDFFFHFLTSNMFFYISGSHKVGENRKLSCTLTSVFHWRNGRAGRSHLYRGQQRWGRIGEPSLWLGIVIRDMTQDSGVSVAFVAHMHNTILGRVQKQLYPMKALLRNEWWRKDRKLFNLGMHIENVEWCLPLMFQSTTTIWQIIPKFNGFQPTMASFITQFLWFLSLSSGKETVDLAQKVSLLWWDSGWSSWGSVCISPHWPFHTLSVQIALGFLKVWLFRVVPCWLGVRNFQEGII